MLCLESSRELNSLLPLLLLDSNFLIKFLLISSCFAARAAAMTSEYPAFYLNAQSSVVTALIFIDFNNRLPILNICDG